MNGYLQQVHVRRSSYGTMAQNTEGNITRSLVGDTGQTFYLSMGTLVRPTFVHLAPVAQTLTSEAKLAQFVGEVKFKANLQGLDTEVVARMLLADANTKTLQSITEGATQPSQTEQAEGNTIDRPIPVAPMESDQIMQENKSLDSKQLVVNFLRTLSTDFSVIKAVVAQAHGLGFDVVVFYDRDADEGIRDAARAWQVFANEHEAIGLSFEPEAYSARKVASYASGGYEVVA
jgi:chorismate mutase